MIQETDSKLEQVMRRENFLTAADVRNVISKYSNGASGDAAETDYLLHSLMQEEDSPVVHYKRKSQKIPYCYHKF